MVILIDIIIRFSSFFMSGFMNDKTIFIYRKLIFDSMFFLLTRIGYLSFSLISGSWNLLFCTICESNKARKILFDFLWSFNLLVIGYVF